MPTEIPGPAYRIRTRRLVLRCWDPADAPRINAAIEQSREHLSPWMPWARDETLSLQERVSFLRRARGRFDLGEDFGYGVFSPDESEVWGGCGLHTRLGPGALEIGYWVHVDHINQGLATELAAALTRVGFEIHDLRRVEIHCDPKNVRSAAVPRKLGFTHEATLAQRVPDGDQGLRDAMIWSLHLADYPASPAAEAQIECFDAVGRRIL